MSIPLLLIYNFTKIALLGLTHFFGTVSFTVLGQLVRLIRLGIRFLFVRPRIRYCFFSPKGRPLKLASRYGVRWQLRPEWTSTTYV